MTSRNFDGLDPNPPTMTNGEKIESLKKILDAYEAIRSLGADEDLKWSVDEQIGDIEEFIATIEALDVLVRQ